MQCLILFLCREWCKEETYNFTYLEFLQIPVFNPSLSRDRDTFSYKWARNAPMWTTLHPGSCLATLGSIVTKADCSPLAHVNQSLKRNGCRSKCASTFGWLFAVRCALGFGIDWVYWNESLAFISGHSQVQAEASDSVSELAGDRTQPGCQLSFTVTHFCNHRLRNSEKLCAPTCSLEMLVNHGWVL